ncbi:NAD+ transporter NDAI_0B01060 [Naumovozyma dairenensis CBS 421]|uniref:Mitochondrial nicotinamide adenine dinucleotide transporter 1 n=1 Tax=Naumovozyma dairenensis (strain ATCC 10597 / BCRC 20456 / CBS 421 / NBRC 0211 / NRRL Y-12639) TaxID=1071378 RepID=G0W5S9_NAUDC|nr:hypothetical protein NDAI_0B01060 [Naumovozyma dairenensis CBS 421]CCD23140.1 hypothetical protein NDAI_0B01060 [Naumovozyma dairenensis CBS 421]
MPHDDDKLNGLKTDFPNGISAPALHNTNITNSTTHIDEVSYVSKERNNIFSSRLIDPIIQLNDKNHNMSSPPSDEPLKSSSPLIFPFKNPLRSIKLSDTKITALSGALAGFLSGVTVCPLDVTKTRLQAQGIEGIENPYYRGLLGTMSTIVKDEGVKGLYKGIVPIIMGYFPTWTIYFSVYEISKDMYSKLLPYSEFLSHSCSAITAGAASTILTNPIWVVKTRLMLQTPMAKHPTYYSGTIDAFRKIIRQEGIRTLYTGLVPSLFGLLHVAIHFPVYEKLKRKLHCDSKETDHSIQLKRLIIASSVSKMIASSITYPHEILRTRMQIKLKSPNPTQRKLFTLIKKTFVQEGIMGFYSGFATNLIRTVPASAITLVSFEYFRNTLIRLNEDSNL